MGATDSKQHRKDSSCLFSADETKTLDGIYTKMLAKTTTVEKSKTTGEKCSYTQLSEYLSAWLRDGHMTHRLYETLCSMSDESDVTPTSFTIHGLRRYLAMLFRGTSTERSLSASVLISKESVISRTEVLQFVTTLLQSYCTITQSHPLAKPWHSPTNEQMEKLALYLIHSLSSKDTGLAEPSIEQSHTEMDIEHWLCHCPLVNHIIDLVFHTCFHFTDRHDPRDPLLPKPVTNPGQTTMLLNQLSTLLLNSSPSTTDATREIPSSPKPSQTQAKPPRHETNSTVEPFPQYERHDPRDPLLPKTVTNPGQTTTSLNQLSTLMLNFHLPRDLISSWRLLFNSGCHGSSFSQMLNRITHQGPVVVIVQDKAGHVFGAFSDTSLKDNSDFYGGYHCYLFTLHPHYAIYNTSGRNQNYVYFNHHAKTLPNGLGFGGQLNYFGLWISESFTSGHSKGGPLCSTYDSPCLASQPEFDIDVIEVWGIGDKADDKSTLSSILDADPGAKAILEMVGKGGHSDGLRDDDETAYIPGEHELPPL